jgi:ABC-type microcin C transport system permease subunit YejB
MFKRLNCIINTMKTIMIVLLLLIGIVLVIPLQQIFAQIGAAEQMMSHMRFTHTQLANNIDQIKQLIKSNNTSEALNLLDGMELKINHMNTMFNDLVWELSNKGH